MIFFIINSTRWNSRSLVFKTLSVQLRSSGCIRIGKIENKIGFNLFNTKNILLILSIVHSLKWKNVYCYELETVYWNIKPFIFTNKYWEIDGIFPKIFEIAEQDCTNDTQNIVYISEVESRNRSLELVRCNTSYGIKELTNITRLKAFWIPVFTCEYNHEALCIANRSLISFQLIKSDKIVVIVPRFVISLPNIMIRGFLGCQKIFVIAMLLCILLGILMWKIDHRYNKKLPVLFFQELPQAFGWVSFLWQLLGIVTLFQKLKLIKCGAIVWLLLV